MRKILISNQDEFSTESSLNLVRGLAVRMLATNLTTQKAKTKEGISSKNSEMATVLTIRSVTNIKK